MKMESVVMLLIIMQALLFCLAVFLDFPVWCITYVYGMFTFTTKQGVDFLNRTKGAHP